MNMLLADLISLNNKVFDLICFTNANKHLKIVLPLRKPVIQCMNYKVSFMNIRVLCIVCCISIASISPAQKSSSQIDSLITKMHVYAVNRINTTLFVHFDKTIYSNHENVWFTAYLLNTNEDIKDYNTLSIALIRNDNRTIPLEEKFVIQNGIASGNLFLPDSLESGNYTFIAFTNRIINKQPEDVFIQPVTIKTVSAEFLASLAVTDTLKSDSDTIKILLKTYTRDLIALPNAELLINRASQW